MAVSKLRSVVSEAEPLSWYQKYMVRRFHPRRIMLDAALMPWLVYFLWQHDWALAILTVAASLFLGALVTNQVNATKYSRTFFGRLAILHLHPTNILLQSLGLIWMIGALWGHSTLGILGSLSLIFLGHLAGWNELLRDQSQDQMPNREIAS